MVSNNGTKRERELVRPLIALPRLVGENRPHKAPKIDGDFAGRLSSVLRATA